MRAYSDYLVVGLALAFAFALTGCGSGTRGTEETRVTGVTGGTASTPLVAQTFDEQCAFCHGSGRIEDVAVAHSIATNSPSVTITGVTIVGGVVTVNFGVVETVNGVSIPRPGIVPNDIRFTIAKLVAPGSGDSTYWQSYINTESTAGANTVVQATYERASANGSAGFTDHGDGTYTYVFQFPQPGPPATYASTIDNITDPVAVNYDPALTHRIAMQVADNTDNAFVDFIPNNLPSLVVPPASNRQIVVTASCNECHVRLGLHGGDRRNVNYCVTCHNPGTTDAGSLNTVDFKVMIHKIHRGKHLPSVLAAPGVRYAIGSHDWGGVPGTGDGGVEFPQDIRNCTKCHKGGPQSDNWKNVPTREACGSCHDRTSFVVPVPAGFELHLGGVQPDNTGCVNCHPADAGGFASAKFPNGVNVKDVHAIPEQVAAAKFQYNIIDVTNTDPGQFPTIRFSVQDPTDSAFNSADPTTATYNILTHPSFSPASSAKRLAILIGWDTKEYTNTGSKVTPAQPISINPLAGAQDNGDGTFTVASTVPIPAGVTSGAVAIEGHPAVESVPGSGTYDLSVPVKSAVKSFPPGTTDRRTVVNIANCDKCHGYLSLHGGNRNDNPQICVICHNANDTDINRRPVPGPGVDGKAEEAIDFKYMVHSIHAAKAGTGFHGFRTNGIVIYGFGGSVNDFSDVRLPSGSGADNLNIRNCLGCHANASTYAVPLNANALPTTIGTGSNRASPDDDVNITPTAAVCSSCHDDIASKTHMAENGAVFSFKAFAPAAAGGSDQAALCGPGPVSSQPAGHTTRTDCCSCHPQK
jgi:OmcA/MtrC family decaheme c-type cytochrome